MLKKYPDIIPKALTFLMTLSVSRVLATCPRAAIQLTGASSSVHQSEEALSPDEAFTRAVERKKSEQSALECLSGFLRSSIAELTITGRNGILMQKRSATAVGDSGFTLMQNTQENEKLWEHDASKLCEHDASKLWEHDVCLEVQYWKP